MRFVLKKKNEWNKDINERIECTSDLYIPMEWSGGQKWQLFFMHTLYLLLDSIAHRYVATVVGEFKHSVSQLFRVVRFYGKEVQFDSKKN